MIDIVTRGMIRPLKVVFVDDNGEEFDPTNPTVEIRHYDNVTEIIDLPETALVRIGIGHYIYSWTVPEDFPLNNIVFVYYRATDLGYRIIIEEKLRVAPVNFFEIESESDMIVKFTKN
jgi:hypothetical protein